MIVLDTNVISAVMRSAPEKRVVDWLNVQPTESIWTTSICVFEVMFELQSMKEGKRYRALQEAFDQVLEQDLDGRVLDFDATAARAAATISAKLGAMGKPVEMRDVQIAGIIEARNGTLATRNTQHFVDTGIPLVNPWDDLPA